MTTIAHHRTGALRALMLAVAVTFSATGCESLLEVENPNNVGETDLQEPGSVAAVVNGALAATGEAYTTITRAHVTLTDEYDWVGSWDAAGELERGTLGRTANDFTKEGFNDVARSRWLSDEAYRLTSLFYDNATLPDTLLLARAALYAGINYLLIADSYEDFAMSSKRESAQPIGPANMHQLYDAAIERFAETAAIAQARSRPELQATALALTARAHYARALWQMMNAGTTPADPLLDVAAANAAAEQALAIAPTADWRYAFTFNSTTTENIAGSWINQRNELIVGGLYASAGPSGKTIEAVTFEDPLTGEVDAALSGVIEEFIAGVQYAPQTVIGTRELHLILAEAALARNDIPDFTTSINAVRALDSMEPYDPGTAPVTPTQVLIHTRLTNLFQQPMRRLADLYRFNIDVEDWDPSSEAATQPGTVFPISDEERLSNCFFNGSC
jgi:hypothetical protein